MVKSDLTKEEQTIKLQDYDFASKHKRQVRVSGARKRRIFLGIACLPVILLATRFPWATKGIGQDEMRGSPSLSPSTQLSSIRISDDPSPMPNPDILTSFRNYPAPDTFYYREKAYASHYSSDSVLNGRIALYLNRYRPEHAVLAVCDIASGAMLGLGERRDSAVTGMPEWFFGKNFPAASLIKILTATAALELNLPFVQDSIPQVGSFHTLYRRQIRVESDSYSRKISLQEAFAKSVNPAFGILGLTLGPETLRRYGKLMGFNQSLHRASESSFPVPDSGFALAESACGFTRGTTISPMHALALARGIGNDGCLRPCLFAADVREVATGDLVSVGPKSWSGAPFISAANLPKLREMMEATVKSGTARKGFHANLKRMHLDRLDLGGKTGSLDGKDPDGRYDWFIGYARLKDDPERGIAICVMLVHGTYQSMRASHLAALVIKDWLNSQKENRPFPLAPPV